MEKGIAVLVPGLFGSQLSQRRKGQRKVVHWLSQASLFENGPDPLDLAPNGIDPGPLANGVNLSPDGIADTGQYEAILNELQTQHWTTDFYSYDWRKSARSNGAELGEYLASRYAGKAIRVIGYSLGGIVSRYAYSRYAALTDRANWIRTIYLGCPQFGSYSAAQSLAVPQGEFTFTRYLALSLGAALQRLGRMTYLQPSLVNRLRQVVASWPSLYDLLPTLAGEWVQKGADAAPLYTLATWSTWNQFVTQQRLDTAAADQAYLNSLLAGEQPNEVSVLGAGVSTPNKVLNPNGIGEDGGYGYTTTGDGYVTQERGTLPTNARQVVDGPHAGLPNSRYVVPKLDDLLLNGLPSDVVVPTAVPPLSAGLPIAPIKPPVVPRVPFVVLTGDP